VRLEGWNDGRRDCEDTAEEGQMGLNRRRRLYGRLLEMN
jgi:hypothetical protein